MSVNSIISKQVRVNTDLVDLNNLLRGISETLFGSPPPPGPSNNSKEPVEVPSSLFNQVRYFQDQTERNASELRGTILRLENLLLGNISTGSAVESVIGGPTRA